MIGSMSGELESRAGETEIALIELNPEGLALKCSSQRWRRNPFQCLPIQRRIAVRPDLALPFRL